LQQKPASEDQNLFKQELDDQLSKWQSTQTSIHCLQNKHFELTQKIKSAYRLILIKKGEENKNEKLMQEAKEATNEKETVKQKISFLIAASQILTIRRINFDIQGCQDKNAIRSFIQQKGQPLKIKIYSRRTWKKNYQDGKTIKHLFATSKSKALN
jgi:hypothetical protein